MVAFSNLNMSFVLETDTIVNELEVSSKASWFIHLYIYIYKICGHFDGN